MKNKDPDAKFQSILQQIMKKSPGVIFHPTNDDMFPKLKSFSTRTKQQKNDTRRTDDRNIKTNKCINRIGAIRILALRITPIFTSKIHALIS
jgi:hypothetical protein